MPEIFFFCVCMNKQRERVSEYTKCNGDMKLTVSQLIAVSPNDIILLQSIIRNFCSYTDPNNDKYHRRKFICLRNINGFGQALASFYSYKLATRPIELEPMSLKISILDHFFLPFSDMRVCARSGIS